MCDRELASPIPGVSLWLCVLDVASDQVAALSRSLSAAEQTRASRFGTQLLRQRWIVGRATLRHRLAKVMQIAPADVGLRRGVRGRPELADNQHIDFNVSHTGGVALIGIADRLRAGARIGVDIELAARQVNVDGLSRKFLTENERVESASMSENARRLRFLRLWTCKEAISKATGDALSAPYGKIEVSLHGTPRLASGPPPYIPQHWTIASVAAPDDLIATMALWQGLPETTGPLLGRPLS